MVHILLVDDDPSLRQIISYNLRKEGFTVETATNGYDALIYLESNSVDLLIADVKMPEMDGITLMEKALGINSNLPVILITAHGTISMAVEAMKKGAKDYITKPFDRDAFLIMLKKVLTNVALEKENKQLKRELMERKGLSPLIGVSDVFQQVLSMIRKIAPTEASVLIVGESGTGKELTALAIHDLSGRSDRPFKAINCAAIPSELLESELFGHAKGAFTGAVSDYRGSFLSANGGTLFLDEIGDMPIDLQAKILRVIESRQVQPIGSNKSVPINVRIISATNKDLRAQINENRFREDLFYRLNVLTLKLPSLRDRKNDIPILVDLFLREFSPSKPLKCTPETINILLNYSWPGNIRQLRNLCQRLAILSESNKVNPSDLPNEILNFKGEEKIVIPEGLFEQEKMLIIQALEKAKWNKTVASRLLSIQRHILLYRIKKYGIKEKEGSN